MADTLGVNLARQGARVVGVTVTTIAPGFMETDMAAASLEGRELSSS